MRKKEEKLFEAAPFFMLRSPIFPKSLYYSILKGHSIDNVLLEFYQKNDLFQEALQVASPSLSEMLLGRDFSEKTLQSLFKYFIRATTRSTPFGLFSFISIGRIEEKSNFHFDSTELRKRARLDFDWIDQFFTDSFDETFSNNTLFQKNPLVYSSSERVWLQYLKKNEESNSHTSCSIRNNALVALILQISEKSVCYSQILSQVKEQIPALDEKQFRGVLKTLLKQQFLIFVSQPTLLSSSTLNDLIENFSNLKLKSIKTLLDSYHKAPFGSGLKQYLSLTKLMGSPDVKKQKKTMLQVDTFCNKDDFQLSEIVVNQLLEALSALWKLNVYNQSEHPMAQYHSQFLEKYGTDRLVPIKELLDPNSGLGLPSYLNEISYPKLFEPSIPYKNWLKEKFSQSLYFNSEEIEITDQDINKLCSSFDVENIPPSTDLFFELSGNSAEEVNRGDCQIILNMISSQGCAAFGRFLDLCQPSHLSCIKDFIKEEERLFENTLFLDSSYQPRSAKSANVASHPSLREHVLDLGNPSKSSFNLDDIYVGANLSRLYLTNQNNDLEIYTTSLNMLNPRLAPGVVQFLREVSKFRFKAFAPWLWFFLENMSYLPRVRYKKVILSRQRWFLDIEAYPFVKDRQKLKSFFSSWADKWKVPRFVLLGIEDQNLLLDRTHPQSLDLILKDLQKNKKIELSESFKNDCIQGKEGKHSAEFVLPVRKMIPYASRLKQRSIHITPSFNKRYQFPGDDWLYFNIFLENKETIPFLLKAVYPFMKYSIETKAIKQWFFVRYVYQNHHLRIRVKGENLFETFFPLLNNWIKRAYANKYIRDFQIAVYSREIERYGGEDSIDAAENCFYRDSVATMELIQAKELKQLTLPSYIIGALSLIHLLKDFNLNEEEIKVTLDSANFEKSALLGIRSWKKTLPRLIHCILKDCYISEVEAYHQELNTLSKIFKLRSEAHQSYLKVLGVQEPLINSPKFLDIVHDLIHMHINRYEGYEREKEAKIRQFASYGLNERDMRSLDYTAHH